MTHFSHIPMVRILLPFLAGVIVFTYAESSISLFTAAIVLGIFLTGALFLRKLFSQHYHYSLLSGLFVMLLLGFLGYILAQNHYELTNPAHFSKFNKTDAMLRIRLTEPVAEKTNSWQIVGRGTHVLNYDSVVKTKGRIIVWLEKDSLAHRLKYGDIILIENYYQEVKEPQNPHAFDYRRFLSRKNIYHQTYRRSNEWHATGANEGNPIIAGSHKMRQKALETLESNNLKGRDFAVASALLLGYREYLDEDLQREFTGAGAMHILCVSGLHVGIIFLALNIIFGFLKRLPAGVFIKTGVIIILIWFYAAITGFSPSVLRASTMFSFVAIGQSFSRSTNIYNTLAASALLLAILDPFIITRIGFQLSYIAVISIVSLQPLFYKQLYFKNKILDHAWGIITVSLAAQLGTGPLALYYFNQFPNYFLLTNLVVIPLTGLIIKGGILLFVMAPVAIVSQWVGLLLSWVVLLLHTAVRIIEGLPGSTANNLVIGFHDKLFIILLISLLGWLWMKKQKALIFPSLLVVLLLVASFSWREISSREKQQLVVYHVPNGTAIDIIKGRNCYFYSCERVRENPSAMAFHIRANRLQSGIKNREPVLLHADTVIGQTLVFHSNFLNVSGNEVLIAGPETPMPSNRIYPDTLHHIIIRGNPRWSIGQLSASYLSHTIIFDNSNSMWRQKKWMEECDSLGLNCWSVAMQGAYVADLKNKPYPTVFP
ncbi:MAG: ComEC/Rec2 family competence protein [Bacteroidota bacterium]